MKNTFKTVIILVLCLAMALSFCACGSSSAPAEEKTAAPASSPEAAAEDTAQTEYVYNSTFTPVTGDEKVSSIVARSFTDDGFYATGEVVTGSKTPDEGVEPQYYGQFFITEPAVFFVGNDGSVRELENYVPYIAPADPIEFYKDSPDDAAEGEVIADGFSEALTEAPAAQEEAAEPSVDADGVVYDDQHPCDGVYAYSNYVGVNSLGKLNDGSLFDLEVMYLNWQDVPELSYDDDDFYDHYTYRNTYFIRRLDQTGKELSSVRLDIPSTEWIYSEGVSDSDGNVLFVRNTETGEYSIVGINPETGERVYEIPCEESLSTVFKDRNGSIYATIWGDSMELRQIDIANKTFGETSALPYDAYSVFTGGGDYPLYYNSGSYFYGFDPASEEGPVRLFNWLDCDINPDDMWSLSVDGDGTVRGLLNNYDNYTMTYSRCLASVGKVPADSVAAKKEITLATQMLSWDMRSAISTFNRKSSDVRIKVIDYSEYNTEDDYSAGLTKLTTEIMAGNCPDILDLNGLSIAQLASKGILEDLYPFLKSDTAINIDDIYPNVLAAAEQDGKLVRTVTTFGINTVVGAASIVGDTPGWNYAELENALRNMPDECTPFSIDMTRGQILSTCLNLDMGSYVNWATGEVNFENEQFENLLKFAATFPDEYDWDTYNWQTDNEEARIAEGRQMLFGTNISTIDQLMYIESSYKGTPVTFIGYPTNNGTGNTIELGAGFAMCSSSTDKAAAWKFLRSFFTEEYYENYFYYYGLPAHKENLEKKLADYCRMTYRVDENGKYVLDANGEKIPEQRYYGMDGGAYTYYCLSKEMADSFRNLIDTTEKISVADEAISDIVTKQSAAFFAGQKSAEETARLIQSNAKIYVNEQR